MAIITLAAPLSGLRGTLGGVVYSANGTTPYARAWSRPATPLTLPQAGQQMLFSQLQSLWRDLSSVQQAAWDTFAALPAQALTNSLGATYYASGANWFCRCNGRLLAMGRSTIAAVPTQARPAAPTIAWAQVTPTGTMTNLCSGGSAGASTSNPSYPANNAFDGTTSYASRWQTADTNPTGWIAYTLPAAKTVKAFGLYLASGFATRYPYTWTFDVFTGGAWSTLYTNTTLAPVADEWNFYYFDNSASSTNYRLDITANTGSGNAVYLSELELYEAVEDASVITYASGEFSASPDYDALVTAAMSPSTGLIVPPQKQIVIAADQSPGDQCIPLQSGLDSVFGAPLEDRAWFLSLYRQTSEGLRSAPDTIRVES